MIDFFAEALVPLWHERGALSINGSQLVQFRRQCEAETSAAIGRFIVGPKVTTMRFDDGAANG